VQQVRFELLTTVTSYFECLHNIYAKYFFSIDSLPRLDNLSKRSFFDVNIFKICSICDCVIFFFVTLSQSVDEMKMNIT
jgi:hypothetical protein